MSEKQNYDHKFIWCKDGFEADSLSWDFEEPEIRYIM